MDNGFPTLGSFPPFIGRVPEVQKPPEVEEKPVEKNPVKKEVQQESKEKTPEIELRFNGPITAEPIYHAVLGIFGQTSDISPVDRNTFTEIIRLTAQKIGSADTANIFNFIRREAHKYSGESKYREFYRVLLMDQKPIKQENPWGK